MTSSFQEIHKTRFCKTGFLPILDALPHGSLQLQLKHIANIQFWQKSNGVTVFPSVELIDKCNKTEALSGVCGTDIRESFPTILFVLPENRQLDIPGGDFSGRVGHLLVSIFDNTEPLFCDVDTKRLSLHMPPGPRHILVTAFWNERYVNNFSIPLTEKSIKQTLEYLNDHFISDEVRVSSMSLSEVKHEQAETFAMSLWAGGLVVNLLLLMQSYPKFVTTMGSQYCRPHVYRDHPPPVTLSMSVARSLLPPVVHESSVIGGNASHHASPTSHWRRGHWRRQRHSDTWLAEQVALGSAPKVIDMPDGRRAHMVWIEPVFVGIAIEEVVK